MATFNSALTWSDTRRYLQDLEAILASGGDTEALNALTALRTARVELQSIFTAAQGGAKRILNELQHSVSRLEAASSDNAAPIDTLRLQTEQLEAKRVALMEQIARLQQERDVSAASMQRLLASTLAYKEQLAALARQQAEEVPTRRHWLALYANITSIRWDYEASEGGAGAGAAAAGGSAGHSHGQGRAIEGYIAPPNGLPSRPFRFDSSLPAPVLADRLWAAVGQAHGLPPE